MLLSDFLRHELGLTGTHVGCEHGVCGACTILVDGLPVRSCLHVRGAGERRAIETVEGLAPRTDAAAPAAGGVPRRARPAVRLLHAGHPDDDEGVPRRAPVADRGRGPRGAVGQPLPLHRLPAHRRGGAARGASGRRRHDHAPVRRAGQAQRGCAAAHRPRAVHRRRAACPGCSTRRSCGARTRTRGSRRSTSRRRSPAKASSPSTPREDLGDYWQPRPDASCRRRRSTGASSTSARKSRSPRTRCATSASRSRWSSRRAATSPRTPRRTIVVDWEPLPVAASSSGRGARRAARPRRSAGQRRRACPRRRRATTPQRAKRAHRVIKRRFAYDHGCAQPMETRGVVAQWDARDASG